MKELTNMNGAVVTERGTSAGGNKMYFFHINKKDSVDMVQEPVVEYQAQHFEFKGVEIPSFGNSTHTEYTYEYEDASDYDYGTEYDHAEQERVVRTMRNRRCRKPKNDLEKFAKYRLGLNLDSLDRIKEGVNNLFN